MSIEIKDRPSVEQIDQVLDQIRPHLETDGGDIRVLKLNDDMIVEVEFLGNCQSCTLSGMTLKNGVEAVIRSHFPDIKAVHEVKRKDHTDAS